MTIKPLAGYKEPKPMVFLGLFPIQSDEINQVRESLGKLRLSDSAFSFRPIHSLALGNGFHCGFLGLLHAEVVQERLSREFNLSLLATAPTVEYRIKLKSQEKRNVILVSEAHPGSVSGSDSGQARMTAANGDKMVTIQSSTEFPDPSLIEETQEPIMEVKIFSPTRYVGQIIELCQSRRGEYIDMSFGGFSVIPASEPESRGIPGQARDTQTDDGLVRFTYIMPLSEMIIDFFDQLKSISEGYASLDYEFFDYQKVDLVKLDILLNHEKVDAFSQLVVADRAEQLGRRLVDKLKDVIPRQQFSIPIQAAIGGKIIARADVAPFRKDVTKKLYGGDRTRKDKLLEAQRKGKAKMKSIGRVEIPQNAFLQVFKRG
jgi:GTP-binding protein LepA